MRYELGSVKNEVCSVKKKDLQCCSVKYDLRSVKKYELWIMNCKMKAMKYRYKK